VEDVPEALLMALDIAGVRDLICATGSLFVVGEIIEAVNEPLIKERLKSEVDK
jgi:hypothetical protein